MYSNATIIGNVGKDPVLRYTPNGKEVCDISVAVNKVRGDDKSTDWWKVTCWGKLAEVVSQHVHKGERVLVQGEPGLETWKGDDGVERSTLTLNAQTVRFLSVKGEAQEEVPF